MNCLKLVSLRFDIFLVAAKQDFWGAIFFFAGVRPILKCKVEQQEQFKNCLGPGQLARTTFIMNAFW
jgi:hypothetical protein